MQSQLIVLYGTMSSLYFFGLFEMLPVFTVYCHACCWYSITDNIRRPDLKPESLPEGLPHCKLHQQDPNFECRRQLLPHCSEEIRSWTCMASDDISVLILHAYGHAFTINSLEINKKLPVYSVFCRQVWWLIAEKRQIGSWHAIANIVALSMLKLCLNAH